MDKITEFGCMLFEGCKPGVNQILSCANQNQQCVNFFPPYANPYIAAIPKCFAKSSRDISYFNVLSTCRTFLVQSGEVTFWGKKKFITVFTGLPPDAGYILQCTRQNINHQSAPAMQCHSDDEALSTKTSFRLWSDLLMVEQVKSNRMQWLGIRR